MIQAAALQMNPQVGEAAANRQQATELITSCTADLYVLPELFSSGYLFAGREQCASLAEPYPDGPTCRFLAAASARAEAVIVGGFAENTPEGRVYNSLAIADHGELLACYRKIHLYDREKEWFDPGNRPPRVVSSSAGRLGPMICFDWIFPETARCLALGGAQILVHAVNLVLPYCQNSMVTRCLENRVFAITANRIGTDIQGENRITFTGQSQITGHDGERLQRASRDQNEVICALIDPRMADNKRLNANNDLLLDRKPGFYGDLLR